MNVVIMAGGGGTRLWPLSRRKQPKQFLDLGSGKTLLEHTYERARALAAPEQIYIATIEEYDTQIKQLLPTLPSDHIFFEPERRDTAPAFAAVAARLQHDGHGTQPTLFMWSDHMFTDEEEFISDAKRLSALLEKHPDTVVVMTHTATFPETGFGYVEAGENVDQEKDVYWVKAFHEKPDSATAKEYVLRGNYFWNMGYIAVQPDTLLHKLKECAPELSQGITEYMAYVSKGQDQEARRRYATLPKISIDYAFLEHVSPIITITGDYGWSDVGNWSAVHEIFGQAGDHVPKGHHIHVDAKNNFIYNATEKTVSLIGVNDTIVVVTPDAILVTHKRDSHRVKDVVAQLESDRKDQYL